MHCSFFDLHAEAIEVNLNPIERQDLLDSHSREECTGSHRAVRFWQEPDDHIALLDGEIDQLLCSLADSANFDRLNRILMKIKDLVELYLVQKPVHEALRCPFVFGFASSFLSQF